MGRRRGRRSLSGVAVAGLVVLGAPPAGSDPGGDLLAPLAAGARVVTPFDPPPRRWMPGHRGVDLAASARAEVRSPAAAVVRFAGSVGGRPVLSLDHGDGLRTTYEPVVASVREGETVVAGQTVGRLLAAHPGCPVDACLHWGARRASGGPGADDDEYLDPMSLLSPDLRPIRLKPLRPGDG